MAKTLSADSGNDLIITTSKIMNGSEVTPYKDIIDCGIGNDRVYVDDIDVYKNCETVNDVKVGIEIESRLPTAALLP
jgi:hypothetical protein